MLEMRAWKTRIYPNKEQKEKIDVNIGCSRFVYNQLLERNIKAYKRRGEHYGQYAMGYFITDMKKYLPWLKDADSRALLYVCEDLDRAYKNFFAKRGGFPKFHSKRGDQSYRTRGCKIQPGKIFMPKMGWVKTAEKNHKWEEDWQICYVAVSKTTDGKYYASITYKHEVDEPDPVEPKKVLGLDYKSDGLYMDSEGNKADMPHYYRKAQKRLAKLQRQLSKKQGSRKGEKKSNNYLKQMARVSKLQKHTANQRKYYLHCLSTQIANEWDAVCIEDLDMKAMANKGFGNGKATNDNGWGMFTQYLGYKLPARGKMLITVDKWYPSSKTCNACGSVKKILKLSERKYVCPACGNVVDRDLNAAMNIRDEGVRSLSVKAA